MDVDLELQFGPGMRVQRLAEGAFLIAAIFTRDVHFAYFTFASTLLQTMSPRWALVAQVVARFRRFSGRHRIGDLYFDLEGSRGACAISLAVQAVALALIAGGYSTAGLVLLTLPTASFLIAPTLGFCAGCWFYVLGRDWLVDRRWVRRGFDDHRDITVDDGSPHDQRELRPTAQR